MNKILFFLCAFVIAAFCNCKGIRNIHSSGEAVEHIATFWKLQNYKPIDSFSIPTKAWYQDSIGITQIRGIRTDETDSSKTTVVTTLGYRFVDLVHKWVYEYKTLSDTAAITRKFPYTDSSFRTGKLSGGWLFDYRITYAIDNLSVLSDTIVSGINAKQCKTSYKENGYRFDRISLFRCDIKKTVFNIDTALSNRMGCPLFYTSRALLGDSGSKFSEEIKFISNSLPDSVQKVFAAWKENEKRYPVQ